jgi:integrase
MPIKVHALTAKAVRELKEPGRHAVGTVPGLMLWISKTGARSWVLRTMVGSRRADIGLGGYPEVTLAIAVDKARENKAEISKGGDPAQRKRTKRVSDERTFQRLAEKYIELKRCEWKSAKHAQQWTNTLEAYAYPTIGAMPVADIEMSHIIKLLQEHWSTKNETMVRVRNRIELILDSAAVQGFRGKDNPARWKGNLSLVLPAPRKVNKRKHHKALPFSAVPSFMKDLSGIEGTSAAALKFAILTAARSGEVRGAIWAEIDMDAGVWEIPKARMKASRPHRVPLPNAAIKLLKSLPQYEGCNLVFPGRKVNKLTATFNPLSDMSLLAVMRRMKVDAVPHGFRSSFRDWAAETTSYPNEVCEMALAHAVGDQTEEAYRRGDLLVKRRQLMEDWAAYLFKPSA